MRAAAESHWRKGQSPSADPVKLSVTYFYDKAAPDLDNLIKPIQDALVGLVFMDDAQVTDIVGRKRRRSGNFTLASASSVLVGGFRLGFEFLHVRIESAPSPEEIG